MTGQRISPTPLELDAVKRALRIEAAAARRAAHLALGAEAGERIAAAFLAGVDCAAGTVVGAYWPIGDEADVRPLLERLGRRGCVAALPVVVSKGAALIFRAWEPGAELESGPHGTWHPAAAAPRVTPDVLLVPALAFDRHGGRLGYGGGYYDRTLQELRARGRVLAVGVGYAAQELRLVPRGGHDQTMDWIVTENAAWEAVP